MHTCGQVDAHCDACAADEECVCDTCWSYMGFILDELKF